MVVLLLASFARASGCDDAYALVAQRDVGNSVLNLSGALSLGWLGAPAFSLDDPVIAVSTAGLAAAGVTVAVPPVVALHGNLTARRDRQLLRDARVGDGIELVRFVDELVDEGVVASRKEVAASLVRGDGFGVFCPEGVPVARAELATWVRLDLAASTEVPR